MGKTVNLLTPLTDAQVTDSTRLLPLADPVSGVAGSGTMAQMKTAIGTQKLTYVATGSEGTIITITALDQMDILLITRESAVMYDVVSGPDSAEYIWDGVNITLGLATEAGERFKILYRNN